MGGNVGDTLATGVVNLIAAAIGKGKA